VTKMNHFEVSGCDQMTKSFLFLTPFYDPTCFPWPSNEMLNPGSSFGFFFLVELWWFRQKWRGGGRRCTFNFIFFWKMENPLTQHRPT